jgi:hypothetical protein
MIGIVAAVGREVEGDRQALLPGRQVAAVEGPRRDDRVDDDERRGAAGAGALHRRRRGAGRSPGNVAAVGREVEGDRQALLPGRQVAAVEGVRILGRGEAGMTPEGIPVKAAYGPQDREGLDLAGSYPGIAPFLRPGCGSSACGSRCWRSLTGTYRRGSARGQWAEGRGTSSVPLRNLHEPPKPPGSCSSRQSPC